MFGGRAEKTKMPLSDRQKSLTCSFVIDTVPGIGRPDGQKMP